MEEDNNNNNNINSKNITHVIFDLDGTLIDSEKYLFNSTNDILKQYGKTYDWTIRSKTIGLHLIKATPIIIEHFELPITPEEYMRQVLIQFKRYVLGEIDGSGVQLLPGTKRLVQHLSKHKIPMAICTGCTEDTFGYKTKSFGDFFKLGNYFHHFVIAGSDPEVGPVLNKPNPQPYKVCMKRFEIENLDPKQVLAFEDSPTGMVSALSAGCQTILIPDPKIDRSNLPMKPTMILNSMEEFKPETFGLPSFDDGIA